MCYLNTFEARLLLSTSHLNKQQLHNYNHKFNIYLTKIYIYIYIHTNKLDRNTLVCMCVK